MRGMFNGVNDRVSRQKRPYYYEVNTFTIADLRIMDGIEEPIVRRDLDFIPKTLQEILDQTHSKFYVYKDGEFIVKK